MKYSLGGKEYDLVFNIYTMELIEKEDREVGDAVAAFRKNRKNIHQVKSMFRAMANSGRNLAGEPEDVTGEEINRLTLKGLDTLATIMNEEFERGLHSETTGGNEADDEKHDVVLEMLQAAEDEKNA